MDWNIVGGKERERGRGGEEGEGDGKREKEIGDVVKIRGLDSDFVMHRATLRPK